MPFKKYWILITSLLIVIFNSNTAFSAEKKPIIKNVNGNIEVDREAFLDRKQKRLEKQRLKEQKKYEAELKLREKIIKIVDIIPDDPQKAEKELKKIDYPLAKLYLAYIYAVGDVKVENKDEVITDILTSIDKKPTKAYHLDVHHILYLINDLSKSNGFFDPLPLWVVQRHPLVIMELFSNARYPQLDFESSLTALSSFKDLRDIGDKIFGKPHCSQIFSIRRLLNSIDFMRLVIAESIPEYYMFYLDSNLTCVRLKTKQAYLTRNDNVFYQLKIWSNQGVYNKDVYSKFMKAYKEADKDLEKYYQKTIDLKKIVQRIKKYQPELYKIKEKEFKSIDNKAKDRLIKEILTIAMFEWVSHYIDHFAYDYRQRMDTYFYQTLTSKPCDGNTLYDYLQKEGYQKEKLINGRQQEINQALRYAALNHQPFYIIDMLLDHGAQINAGNESALMMVINDPKLTQYLIDKGAKVDYENYLGKTALHYAAQFNDLATVKVLVENGADVNKQLKTAKQVQICEEYNISKGSMLPLIYAAEYSNLDVVKYLVSKGADITEVDDNGQTAVDYAKDEQVKNYLTDLLNKKSKQKFNEMLESVKQYLNAE